MRLGFTDARMEATARTVQDALSSIKDEEVRNMVDEKWQSLTESPACAKSLHDLCLEGDQFWKDLKMTAAMLGSIRAGQTRTQNSGGPGNSITANIANTRGGNAIKCEICSQVCQMRKEHPRGTEWCFLREREGDEKKKWKISTMMRTDVKKRFGLQLARGCSLLLPKIMPRFRLSTGSRAHGQLDVYDTDERH